MDIKLLRFWNVIVIAGLLYMYYAKEISTDTYLLCLVGCGIWQSLLKEEE